ncbi:MAG: hypothetical protein JF606_22700 [Burkholderiales bacterium]|nr:hypothetical protein [Burkholderiales bacterium]
MHDLADALNIVSALCDLDKLNVPQVKPLIELAADAMVDAATCESGQIRMGEAEFLALREVVTIYDSAIGRFSAQTISAATAHVVLKVARARRAGLSIEF